jgi:hypothetical protein
MSRLLSRLIGPPVIALCLVLVAAAPSSARPRARSAVAAGYVDPFAATGWEPSRTDMGVDWVPARPLPVVAIGDAVILGAENHAPWPGHHFIWYRLLTGSHAGDVVYVAENLRHLARAGTYIRAGQPIAVAMPSYPWTEWGWADASGSPLAYPCYKNGTQTPAGRQMARFIEELGAATYDTPGAGPDHPTTRRCSRVS